MSMPATLAAIVCFLLYHDHLLIMAVQCPPNFKKILRSDYIWNFWFINPAKDRSPAKCVVH